jgi:hypothetical protein
VVVVVVVGAAEPFINPEEQDPKPGGTRLWNPPSSRVQ